MPEANLVETEHGVVPESEGWFVANARDVPWVHTDRLGSACFFEGESRFPELGINLNVLPPGDAGAMYHAEGSQEDFLVIFGEGVVVVEREERPLRPWDLFHSPADTPHVLVATGDQPFIYVAVGSRGKEREGRLLYPVDETAQRRNAGVSEETSEGKVAYDGVVLERGSYRDGDLPG